MYHLICSTANAANGDYIHFMVVRDTDYSSTDWEKTITDLEFLHTGAHWDRYNNAGKPIEDTLSNRQILLASADTFAEVTKDTYPELQI